MIRESTVEMIDSDHVELIVIRRELAFLTRLLPQPSIEDFGRSLHLANRHIVILLP